MDVNYSYLKPRRDFGKHCRFSIARSKEPVNIISDFSLEEQWIPKNPCNKGTNIGVEWSMHEANTERVKYMTTSIHHKEGGWPKDINIEDPEQVVRYRKKTEKDESYFQSVLQMSKLMEHYLNQNNSINIYQAYFTDPNCQKIQTLAPSFKTIAVMSDVCVPSRPVHHISWSPDQGTLVAISYVNMGFQMADPDSSPHSFIFDLEDPTTPYLTVESPHPVVTLEFNHRDAQCLAGGLMSGQVAFWDVRKGSSNVAISDMRNSHRDPVRSLHWINSKTSTAFYTGSSDGQVMWWDARKLSKPTEVLILDLAKNEKVDEPEWLKWSRSHGVTCMDYNPAIPIRFMIGTETGLVFNGNRKGKTISEKISATFYCHAGPLYSVQRNPTFLKNFLTIGDCQVRIWSEDVKESPIMWTKRHDVRLTDGAWSESKPSVFYTTRADGWMESWDILQNQKDPILTIKVADEGLNCIRCHEGGALIAVGDDCGKTHVIEMNDWFVTPGKNDKALLTTMFDRETRREKIIEAKQRELRLKTNSSAKIDATTIKVKHVEMAKVEAKMIQEAEKQFMEMLAMIEKEEENLNPMDNKKEG